jgi:hypothetical protein
MRGSRTYWSPARCPELPLSPLPLVGMVGPTRRCRRPGNPGGLLIAARETDDVTPAGRRGPRGRPLRWCSRRPEHRQTLLAEHRPGRIRTCDLGIKSCLHGVWPLSGKLSFFPEMKGFTLRRQRLVSVHFGRHWSRSGHRARHSGARPESPLPVAVCFASCYRRAYRHSVEGAEIGRVLIAPDSLTPSPHVPRPPPYDALHATSGRNPWRQISLHSRLSSSAESPLLAPVASTGLHKGLHPLCLN